MLRFGTSVSYGGADTPRSDQGAGADPARTGQSGAGTQAATPGEGSVPPARLPAPTQREEAADRNHIHQPKRALERSQEFSSYIFKS